MKLDRGRNRWMSLFLLGALVWLPRGAASQPASISGHWVGSIPLDEKRTPTLILDVDQLGSRWVGEFDVAEFGIEDYPVKVELAGDTVKLGFSADEANFEGKRSTDGALITGLLDLDGHRVEIELKRLGKAAISENFLRLEAAADDASSVSSLAANGAELRDRFNADRKKLRLVMLLSPT